MQSAKGRHGNLMLNEGGDKYLTVEQLIVVLAAMPMDARLYPNRVGNLGVTDSSDTYLGFIDFLHEGEFEHG